MAQYAIVRVAKLKTTNAIKAVSNHNHRHGKAENANPNKENKILIGTNNALQDWQNRISETNIFIRNKATVRGLEILLTTSNSIGKAMLKNEKAMNTWIDDELRFLKSEYGEKNIVNAVLHLDETTPHIHAVVVPEFENKLNAKHFTGGKKAMADFQTRHFENLSPMLKKPLSRGKKFSTAKHKTMAEMYNAENGPVDFQKQQSEILFFKEENELLKNENSILKTRNAKLSKVNNKLADKIRVLKNPQLATEKEQYEKKKLEPIFTKEETTRRERARQNAVKLENIIVPKQQAAALTLTMRR